MSVSVVIVGINQWEEYTRPLIAQLWYHEPDVEIICVDNASDVPYPQKADHVIRSDERLCYSAAINLGFSKAKGDWLLSLNNDIRCNEKFVAYIEQLDPANIYGRQIITEAGHTWLGNWLCLMRKETFAKVGEFDPNFLACGFEDADYCVRAASMGIATKAVDLPFTHLWGKTRWAIPGYEKTREHNIDYFEKKHGFRLGQNMQVIHD